jgi:L-ascorbate metabolism protein UlaG (beta-lactamase superfamily)
MDRSIARRAAALRRERMQASPRWVDGAFRNIHPVLPQLQQRAPMPPLLDFFRGRPGKRPLAPLPALDPRPGWQAPPATGLRATWLGHSTVLLEIDGMRLLTDPVWGARLSPVPLLAPRRFQPVPLAIDALPPLDAVLISHDHFDHLDRGSIEQLARRDGLPFVTALGVGAHLAAWGVPLARIHELDWWESVQIGALSISATPSQHFSGRGIGRNATLWASFAVRGPRHALFFSGDTGLTTEYVQVRERLGPFDLILLEVGAFHPAWSDIHLGPENALRALELLGGGSFLPVHWGTFDLALHAWDEPAEQLLQLAPRHAVHLLMPRLGEPVEPAHTERVEPWWRAVAALERRAALQESAPEPERALADAVVIAPAQLPLD